MASTKRVLIPVGLGTALSLIGDSSLYTVLPTHTAAAGVLLASVGILLSANRWVRLVANNFAGWICDRYSKRNVFIAALFLGAMSTASYAFSFGFWSLLVGRLLWGVAWAGIWVAGNGIVLEAAPAAVRGRWVGRYQVSFFLGAAAGAYLGGLITDLVGYRQAMMVAAFLALVGAGQALMLVPKTFKPSMPAENERLTSPDSLISGPARNNKRVNWLELASATIVLGINRIVIAGILVATFGLYLLEVFGETLEIGAVVIGVATLTGLALGTTTLLSMVFTPIMGSLSDRAMSRWQVVLGGQVPGMVGFGLLALTFPAAILFGLPLVSITSSSNQSLSTSLMGDLAGGKRQGRYLGFLYTVGDLGSAIGPVLAFAILPLWGLSGLYRLNVILYGSLFLIAAYWSWRRVTSVALDHTNRFDQA